MADSRTKTATIRQLIAQGDTREQLLARGYTSPAIAYAQKQTGASGRPWDVREFAGVADVLRWLESSEKRPTRDLEAAIRVCLAEIERLRKTLRRERAEKRVKKTR